MTTLLTQEFPPAPGGMNVALPQSQLDDTEARYLQDILVDYPGLARRRGPLTGVAGLAALTRKASGFAITLNPLGQDRYGVFTGDAGNGFFEVYAADFASKNALTWPHPLPADPGSGAATAYRIFDIKPALGGGAMMGVSSSYDANSPNQGIAFWKGGINANGTGTITVAKGSAAVTGTGFNASLSPGMWIFANTDEGYTAALIGCVQSVNSDSSVTLTTPSPYALTAKSANYQALRGIYPQVTVGRITCDTSSPTVNGGATKFVSQGLTPTSSAVGIWNLYRASDFTWIGRVKSVESETSLTLGTPGGANANAALSMSDGAYVAIKADADFSVTNTGNISKVGFLNAVYSERQFYANLGQQYSKTSRIWFSDIANPEALDVTNDGNWIDIDSTSMINESIRGLIPAYNSLVIVKENETFGLFGSSPSQFAVRKIHDDGTLSGMSIQAFGGGAIWAGREGIHYFDGTQVQNLMQTKFGDVWKNSIRSFDPSRYRMWSMLVRNHYYCFIESLAPTIGVVKGNVSSTPTTWGVMINMSTRAVSLLTNLNIRGAVTLPASTGKQVWFVANDATKGIVCDTDFLFDNEGTDTFACDSGTAGPDFFFESKKFDVGQELRLKRFKQLAIHYLIQGADLKVDTVLGLNNIGTTLSTVFPASVFTWDTLRASVGTWDLLKAQFATWNDIIQGVFVPKRVRFLKRSQHFSFRLYQSSSAASRVKIGPFEIGFKQMRPGRV